MTKALSMKGVGEGTCGNCMSTRFQSFCHQLAAAALLLESVCGNALVPTLPPKYLRLLRVKFYPFSHVTDGWRASPFYKTIMTNTFGIQFSLLLAQFGLQKLLEAEGWTRGVIPKNSAVLFV